MRCVLVTVSLEAKCKKVLSKGLIRVERGIILDVIEGFTS